MNARDLLITAEPPWHRLEHGAPREGRLPLLGALKPEFGWPRWILRVPMRWHGGDRYERLDAPLAFERFVPPGQGQPGEPWRFELPLTHFPEAEAGAASGDETDTPLPGLLLLAVYLEPRALAMEGVHRGHLDGHLDSRHDWPEPELRRQLEAAAAQLLALPVWRWWQGFVAHPEALLPPAVAGSEDDAAELSFAVAACQYPPGLLDVSPGCENDPAQASPALASLSRLQKLARGTPMGRELSLLLLAGDQIYADASGGLADSRSGLERYARGYREFKAGPVRHLPPTLARIVHSVDDHEIVDNWEPVEGQGDGLWFDAARQAAWDHRWEAGERIGGPLCLWHDFDWRGAAFFVADARCERQARRVATWSRARLWSEAQRDAFSSWLSRAADRPRFVLCGSLPLPRKRMTAEHPASCLRSDAWDGYPHSLHELLGAIWAARADGTVLLSGDEHRSGWISAEIAPVDADPSASSERVRLHSIHSSALYAPWPFAITAAEELAAPEAFEFDGPDGRRLRCTVGAWTDHPGDGFAVLRVRDGRLSLWFDRAGRPLHRHADEPPPDGELDLGRAP